MADSMFFPEKWEDFLLDYEFEDSQEIYTNGSMLIPSFRVEQMMEHYGSVKRGRWVCLEPEIGYYACSECDHRILRAKCNYCPGCGARMEEPCKNLARPIAKAMAEQWAGQAKEVDSDASDDG